MLTGVSIGASYLSGDVEAQVRDKIRVMHGEFHYKLTPETDFLICGRRWTEKYNYAVEHEITLISPDAFFDAHVRWVHGEELDMRSFLLERRLKPFENMTLTITNMENEQRTRFQALLEAQGAAYVQSLNQRVSALVSPLDRGKKVNGARKWQIPVVSPKWMTDSGKIGAALDPVNYDPGNPRASMEPPVIQKKPAKIEEPAPRKRKLANPGLLAKRVSSIGSTFIQPAKLPPTDRPIEPRAEMGEIFKSVVFSHTGFDDRESRILTHTIRSLGGEIDASRPDYVVVKSSSPEKVETTAKVVTEWAIERSLFHKTGHLDTVWGRPVYAQPCKGFNNVRVCISGFTELDQRHVTLLIKLLGAEFMETLTADRELLVASSSQAHKVRYAKNWGVPVVSVDWLWQCVQEGTMLPIAAQHCLDQLGFRPAPRRRNTASPIESTPARPTDSHRKIGRMIANSSQDLTPVVRYRDDDVTEKAQILLALGERPPTPPAAEQKAPTIRDMRRPRPRSNRTTE